MIDLLEHGAGAVALIGLQAVAHHGEIGDQIAPILCRQPEIEHPIEMRHHLIVTVVAAVMEIRRVEIAVAQRRRLEEAARADIVLLVIDECGRRNMTAGAAQVRIVRERFFKNSASPRRSASLICPSIARRDRAPDWAENRCRGHRANDGVENDR